MFSNHVPVHPRNLPSFPTRRSSDLNTPIDETLEALDAVVRSGKARYVGCSNYLAYQLARAIGRSEVRSVVRFSSVDRKSTRLNSSHRCISYAVFCLKKKKSKTS